MTLCSLGLGTRSGVATGASAPPPSFATPLATSVQTSAGTWATVPMGHLNQPLNTFWQLFFRPAGATSWSNEVKATATNGGLVLADADHQLVVGIRPSFKLRFTPVIATTDAGASWTTGLIDSELAPRPSALAVDPAGQALAIVDNSSGQASVVTSAAGLSSWRELLTEPSLAERSCRPNALTAVGYLGTTALLGTSCARAGVALFLSQGSGWQAVGPALPRWGAPEVLGLVPSPTGLAGLFGLLGGGHDGLVAAWTTNGIGWSASPTLPVPRTDRLVSYGPSGGGGIFVLFRGPSGTKQLYVIGGPGADWHQLPPPPPSTATVAAVAGSTADALGVHDTVLTVWSLDASNKWTVSQTLHIPIQFGSSNP
jgi:hypothetical protein